MVDQIQLFTWFTNNCNLISIKLELRGKHQRSN